MQRACAPQRSVTCVYITAEDTPLGNCCRSLTSSAATKAAPGGAAALHRGFPSRCALCCLRSLVRCEIDARWARSAATMSTKAAILYYSSGIWLVRHGGRPLVPFPTALAVHVRVLSRLSQILLASAALHKFAQTPFSV